MKKIIALLFVVLVAGCIGEDAFHRNLGPNTLTFRANLFEAEKVEMNDEELAVKTLLSPDMMWNTLTIAFVPNETENSYYAATGSEIAKYIFIYRYVFNEFNIVPEVQTIPVENATEAAKLVNSTNIVILMLGPSQTNRTAVTVYENFIVLEGARFHEKRSYTDLDLAMGKLLLVLLKAAQTS